MSLFGNVGARVDPALNHNFLVSLVDTTTPLAFLEPFGLSFVTEVPVGGFSECSGMEMAMQAEEYKEGGRNGAVLKFPNRITWSPIVLKSGISVGTELWDWFYGFVEGKGRRRDGTITLLDEQRLPSRIWFFQRGLPTKYTGPSLNATQNNVAMEALEIAHEGLYQVPGIGPVLSGIGALAGLLG
jgi:phage tail-like protein